MQRLGTWLGFTRHSYSHLSAVYGSVMLILLTSACSSLVGAAATTAVRAATGQGSGGLEVSPNLQVGRENISNTTQGAVNQTTDIARDQIINGPDFLMLIGIMFMIGIIATMLGYFASDNIQKWINRKK